MINAPFESVLLEGECTGEGKKTLYQLRYSAYDYDAMIMVLQYYFLFMNVRKPVRANAIKIQNGSKIL